MIIFLMLLSFSKITVDNTSYCGTYSSITYLGDIAISYYDLSNNNLKFAWRTGSTWNKYTVDSNGDVGLYTSIAPAGDGDVYISYYDATNTALKVAKGFGTNFTTETVDNIGDVGMYTSLVVWSDTVYVFYYNRTNGNLKMAKKNGSWSTSTVDATGDVGMYTSAAVDGGGNIHISYYDNTNDDLKYGFFDGTWHLERVDDGGQYSSISVANDGTVHFFYNSEYGRLKHAYRSGGNWNFEQVSGLGRSGNSISSTCDRMGLPIVSFVHLLSAATPYLDLARYNGTDWDIYESIDSVAGVKFTSIVIGDGDVYVSYFKGNPENELRVLYYPEGGIKDNDDNNVHPRRYPEGKFDFLGRRIKENERIYFENGRKKIIIK